MPTFITILKSDDRKARNTGFFFFFFQLDFLYFQLATISYLATVSYIEDSVGPPS